MDPINQADKQRLEQAEKRRAENLQKLKARKLKCRQKIARFELQILDHQKQIVDCEAVIKKLQLEEKKHNGDIKERNNKKREQANDIEDLRYLIKKLRSKLSDLRDKEIKKTDKLKELKFQKSSMKAEIVEAEYDQKLRDIEYKLNTAVTDKDRSLLKSKRAELLTEQKGAYAKQQHSLEQAIIATQVELQDIPQKASALEAQISEAKAKKKNVKNKKLEDAEDIMPLLIDVKLQITESTTTLKKLQEELKFKKGKVSRYQNKARKSKANAKAIKAGAEPARSSCCLIY